MQKFDYINGDTTVQLLNLNVGRDALISYVTYKTSVEGRQREGQCYLISVFVRTCFCSIIWAACATTGSMFILATATTLSCLLLQHIHTTHLRCRPECNCSKHSVYVHQLHGTLHPQGFSCRQCNYCYVNLT